MNLDLATMIWVMVLSSFVLAFAVLLVAGPTRFSDGMAAWGWGLFVQGLSNLAFTLRYEGWQFASVLSSNLLTSTTMALHLLAIGQFQRGRMRPLPRWLVWGPTVAVGLVALLLLSDAQKRTTVLALLFMLQAGLLAWKAVSPGLQGKRERGRILLALGSSFLVLVFAYRSLYSATAQDWALDVSVPTGIQSVTYLLSLMVMLASTVGFVLMQQERAVALKHEQATHDALTGVANRRALMEAMERSMALCARQGTQLALVMLDIDFFKRVNDNHGHLAGDAVLKEVAARIAQRLRAQDLLGRYGGEEFLVLLPGTDAAGALQVANDIRVAVQAQPVLFQGSPITITLSAGVHVRIPTGAHTALDEMIGSADRALYLAKERGRNRVELLP